MIAFIRSDASHLHGKTLQLQLIHGPREVKVPHSAPKGKQERMLWLRTVVGIMSFQPHSKQQEHQLRSSNEGPVPFQEELLPQDLLHHVGFIPPVPVLNTKWVIQSLCLVSNKE